MGVNTVGRIPREIESRYRVLQELGRPDLWETYLAEEVDTGRTCVVRLDREKPENPRERRHLEESYLSLRRLRHPGLPQVLHLGMLRSGGHYLVHEFVRGASLRNMARYIDFAGMADVLAKLLPALHLLHLHGIVHQRIVSDGRNGFTRANQFSTKISCLQTHPGGRATKGGSG